MTHRETQTWAWRAIQENGLLSSLRFRVFDIVYTHDSETGMTSGELDRMMTRDGGAWTRSASPRLNELVKLDVLEELPPRKCKATGQTVLAYRTTGRLPNPAGLSRNPKKTDPRDERIRELEELVEALRRENARMASKLHHEQRTLF